MTFNVGDIVNVRCNNYRLAEYVGDSTNSNFSQSVRCIVLSNNSSIRDMGYVVGLIEGESSHIHANYPCAMYGKYFYWNIHPSNLSLAKKIKIRKDKFIICRACGSKSKWLLGTSKKAFICISCRAL